MRHSKLIEELLREYSAYKPFQHKHTEFAVG